MIYCLGPRFWLGRIKDVVDNDILSRCVDMERRDLAILHLDVFVPDQIIHTAYPRPSL